MAARPYTFPAPVRGWIENENLAMNQGVGASVMENVFPLQATVRLRGGAQLAATVGDAPVLSLIPYQAGTTQKLFAATATAVHDISSFSVTTAPVAFSGQTSGRWSHVQFGTAGGNFVVMVNGTDPMRYFDGTAWAAVTGSGFPSITGVSTSALSHVWIHGSRAWFVQKNTLSAWYLPVDSIGGAATEFALSGVFKRGGNLLFGGAWSSDSGDGMDDRIFFVTDLGEIAVYAGTDPGSSSTWALTGRYDMGDPISTQVLASGGDVLFATADGLVPISAVATRDPTTLALAAVSAAIEPSWLRAFRLRDPARPFTMLKWHRESMGIVGIPHRDETFILNMRTGAWAKFTGWDVQSLGLYNGLAYYGDSAGNVFQIEAGGSDNGAPYVARVAWLPDHLGAPGAEKIVGMARGTFLATTPFTARLSVATNYGKAFPLPPNAAAVTGTPGVWDLGVWDVSRWDDSPDADEKVTAKTRWRSIGRSGFSISPQVQITNGSTRRPDAELVAFDLTFEPGGTVV